MSIVRQPTITTGRIPKSEATATLELPLGDSFVFHELLFQAPADTDIKRLHRAAQHVLAQMSAQGIFPRVIFQVGGVRMTFQEGGAL